MLNHPLVCREKSDLSPSQGNLQSSSIKQLQQSIHKLGEMGKVYFSHHVTFNSHISKEK